MTGVEIVAGRAVGYLLRRLRRVDGLQVLGLDSALEELRQLVVRTLGDDSALVLLRQQAAEGTVSERTKRRAADAIAEAAECYDEFAVSLRHLIDRLTDLDRQAGSTAYRFRSAVRDHACEGIQGVVHGAMNTGEADS